MELIPPSDDQLKIICNDINLDPEQHKRDTQTLKTWLKTQPHLPQDIDDSLLGSFIVGCKNSLERAKQSLDGYLSNRTSCPEFYQDRDPCNPAFRKTSKIIQYTMLPKMTPEGYRVSIFSLKTPDISAADFDMRLNAIKVLCSYDIRFLEDQFWAGDITIVDCRNFTFKLLPAMAVLPLLKKYIHCVSDSLPVRFKKIIYFNLAPVIETVLSMIKPLVKQKIVQRMIITTEDHTCLYKHVPKDMLPEEYGGKAGKIDYINEAWQLKVECYQDWFLKDMKRKVDESLRPEKSQFKPKQHFGIEGSFKMLTVD